MCFTLAIMGFTFSAFCVLWLYATFFFSLSFLSADLELDLEMKINMAMIFTQCWLVGAWMDDVSGVWCGGAWDGGLGWFLGAWRSPSWPLCICLWTLPAAHKVVWKQKTAAGQLLGSERLKNVCVFASVACMGIWIYVCTVMFIHTQAHRTHIHTPTNNARQHQQQEQEPENFVN